MQQGWCRACGKWWPLINGRLTRHQATVNGKEVLCKGEGKRPGQVRSA